MRESTTRRQLRRATIRWRTPPASQLAQDVFHGNTRPFDHWLAKHDSRVDFNTVVYHATTSISPFILARGHAKNKALSYPSTSLPGVRPGLPKEAQALSNAKGKSKGGRHANSTHHSWPGQGRLPRARRGGSRPHNSSCARSRQPAGQRKEKSPVTGDRTGHVTGEVEATVAFGNG